MLSRMLRDAILAELAKDDRSIGQLLRQFKADYDPTEIRAAISTLADRQQVDVFYSCGSWIVVLPMCGSGVAA